MMEYFTYKKFKKNKSDKDAKAKEEEKGKGKEESTAKLAEEDKGKSPAVATPEPSTGPTVTVTSPAPVLEESDEAWFKRILGDADADGPPPPLPARIKTPDLSWEHSDDDRMSAKSVERPAPVKKGSETKTETKAKPDEGKKKEDKKENAAVGLARKASTRLSVMFSKDKKTGHLTPTTEEAPESQASTSTSEEDREKRDLSRVLDDLNLAARNNKVFSLSEDSAELVRQFTLVLKDLVNGVPTAANDMVRLLDDRDGVLARNFEKLPGSLKRLVTQLPTKLTGGLAPELLAAAAEAQGIKADGAAGTAGLKGTAKKMFTPSNLQEMITKPGTIVGMLRGIMNALKLRWPAFIGTNVLWSLALFLLLFVLWYCHKRGREVRLEKEASSQEPIDGSTRIEELPDDPALPAPPASSGLESLGIGAKTELPPPPIGEHAPKSTASRPE